MPARGNFFSSQSVFKACHVTECVIVYVYEIVTNTLYTTSSFESATDLLDLCNFKPRQSIQLNNNLILLWLHDNTLVYTYTH